MLAKIQVSA